MNDGPHWFVTYAAGVFLGIALGYLFMYLGNCA